MECLVYFSLCQEQDNSFYFHIRHLFGVLLVRRSVAVHARGYLCFSFMTLSVDITVLFNIYLSNPAGWVSNSQ